MKETGGNCKVCGRSLPSEVGSSGGFCSGCGMKYLPGAAPAFMPADLMAASGKGEAGFAELADRVGMPVENLRRIEAIFKQAAAAGHQAPDAVAGNPAGQSPSHAGDAPAGRHAAAGTSAAANSGPAPSSPPTRGMNGGDACTRDPAVTNPPGGGEADAGVSSHFDTGGGLASGFDTRPRLLFGYDDAFILGEAGIVRLELSLEDARGDEQDIKLTLDGDIAKPFNVNMLDLLGREKEIVVTPTSFPASRIVFKLSCFDGQGEPHCWIGETAIADVEKPVEDDSSKQVIISSTFQTGDGKHIGDSTASQNINLSGLDGGGMLKRRKLQQPRRCEVALRPDDEAERELKATASALRIEAMEIFARAENRARKGKLEKAYELIRQVEERGFLLRKAQDLRSQIERGLSELSLERGRGLFGEGRLKEAYKLLQERKLLVFNQGIVDLLMEIEDIDEACDEAIKAMDDGNLDKAQVLIDEALQACPAYEYAKKLKDRLEAERRRIEVEEQEEEEKRILRMREEEERRRLEQELEERRASVEARIAEALHDRRWRPLFDAITEYRSIGGYDESLVDKALGEYLADTNLTSLAKFIPPEQGPGENELPPLPHLLIIAGTEALIGRHNTNPIILNDSSRRTGRTHGRIILAQPGKWVIQRYKGESSKLHRIFINGEELAENEAVEIIDDDLISFADVVKLKAYIPDEAPLGAGVELRIEELQPRDEEFKDLLRWILMDKEILAGGGNDCHLRIPLVEGRAFVLKLAGDVFWMYPPPLSGGGALEVTVGGLPLDRPRPLLHGETLTIGGYEYYFYHLRKTEELWQWEDELDDRGLRT